jgi:aryl-alcohol dehydrogenase-like predicted oxidoreductase
MIERTELRPGYSISRIIKGGWHLAGGHGHIDQETAIADMKAFVQAGITTFDCADIYTGVEELIGQFLSQHQEEFQEGSLPPVQIHTKYVPDYNALATITKEKTTAIIDRSLRRLGVERLDMVQFSWWNYEVKGYVEAALHLQELKEAGKIRFIGTTNFDAARLSEIIEAGVDVVSAQVQYSALDHRPESKLYEVAKEHDFYYLCYGSIAGGFLSDKYLGEEDPEGPLENRSLTKYRLIIDEFGGYALFQELLQQLRKVADKHQVGIAEVAARYVLQKPQVAAVIVGARNRKHLQKLETISGFFLDDEDLDLIAEVVAQSSGPLGPVYDLERDKEGKHGRIMKYNINSI